MTINRQTAERINELSKRNNEILSSIKGLDKIKFATDLKLKLGMFMDDIVNIEYALHCANLGIVKSVILSDKEIKTVEGIIMTSGWKFTKI